MSMLFPRPKRWERLGGEWRTSPVWSTQGLPADGLIALDGLHPATIRTRLHRWRPSQATSCPDLSLQLDPDLGTECFTLEVRSESEQAVATIKGGDPAALMHGIVALEQLYLAADRGDFGLGTNRGPCVRIEDRPAMLRRGVMLDISRCRIPTMNRFAEILRHLSRLRFNHLQLYVEHTFLGDHPTRSETEVASPWCHLTPDELSRIDDLAHECGIELAANQNCFGHLREWLLHPEFAPLAEITGPDEVWRFMSFDRRGPFSLCPIDPGSPDFVRRRLDAMLPCVRSRLVNIGCDETFDVGQGRSRDRVEREGKGRVWSRFVSSICECAAAHNKQPMAWADMALTHPEALRDWPRDLIGLVWGYEADSPFLDSLKRLQPYGIEAWLCPGTSSWRSILGRRTERFHNISGAADAAAMTGADSLLICDWGDVGHMQGFTFSLPGLVETAAASWHGTLDEFDHESAWRALGLADRGGAWIDALGDIDADLRRTGARPSSGGAPRPLRNASALFCELFPPVPVPEGMWNVEANDQAWEPVRDRIVDSLGRLTSELISDPHTKNEVAWALELALLSTDLALARRRSGLISERDRADFADRIDTLIAEHRRLWLLTSRVGGLEQSCSRLASLRGSLVQRS